MPRRTCALRNDKVGCAEMSADWFVFRARDPDETASGYQTAKYLALHEAWRSVSEQLAQATHLKESRRRLFDTLQEIGRLVGIEHPDPTRITDAVKTLVDAQQVNL